jgi:hypothetical protein
MTQTFSKGDSVIHTGKPEWGPGDVLSAEGHMHEGKSFQRLSIRFSRAGLKTISTAFAELKLATRDVVPPVPQPMPHSSGHARTGGGGLGSVAVASAPASPATREPSLTAVLMGEDNRTPIEALQQVPEAAIDPFLSLTERLKAMLATYRFADSPAGLIDWAVIQTGMKDPFTKFSRHALEVQWERFRITMDNHLKKLLPQVRKAAPQEMAAIIAASGHAAKQAVRRVDIGR